MNTLKLPIALFDIGLYNDDFFQWHETHTKEYILSTMDWYMDVFKPETVVDFGCGNGYYLESACAKGADVFGFEIAKDKALPYISSSVVDSILPFNICNIIEIGDRFDCVISIETAEHIEPLGTYQYIKNLINHCSKDGMILFTGAPEEQGGSGHINCKPKEEWLKLFEEQGATYNHELTEQIKIGWADSPAYIKSNLLVFKCN